jgi:hypothetical protein
MSIMKYVDRGYKHTAMIRLPANMFVGRKCSPSGWSPRKAVVVGEATHAELSIMLGSESERIVALARQTLCSRASPSFVQV